jgi:hypothetical protein
LLSNSFYEEKLIHCREQLALIRRKINLVAFLRMLFFLGFAIWVFLLLRGFQYYFLFLALAFLASFILLVRASLGLKEKRGLFDRLLYINDNELEILKGKPNRFNDGKSFGADDGGPDDLDIFGPRSLFHFLNRTTTTRGSGLLASMLTRPFQDIGKIEEYQRAVRELSHQPDHRQVLTAYGLLHKEEEWVEESIKEWLGTFPELSSRKWVRTIRWLFPMANLVSIFYYFASGNFIPFLIGIFLCLGATRIFKKYIARQYLLIGKKQSLLDQYASILESFGATESRSSVLLKQLVVTAAKAHRAIRRLSRITSFFDQRLGLLAGFFYNSLFLHDLQCLIELEDWKKTNQDEFESWMDCMGNIEYLNSLAGFAFNNPSFCYAEFLGGPMMIEATGLAHPLIPEKERVANDFSIGGQNKLLLITGSNMSGKTTFLRTLGVNLLLAQCGAPSCASSFRCMPMQILSSLRISDSLQEHTSYFMAELKKLQQIILNLKKGLPALVLIDEILRGTNSEDKTFGSEQFIHTLLQYDCLTLFATHDLSLSQLEFSHPALISNYCFESSIEDGRLYFDYKLRKGIAKNRNASFLMKQMGLI